MTVTGTQTADFQLIRDTDTTFSSGATTVAAASFSGNVVTFSNIDIDDGDYLALGTTTGALSVIIQDGSGDTVTSPSVSFANAGRSDGTQTITGTLGTTSEKIVVGNSTNNTQWSLTAAASNTTALWVDGLSLIHI